MRRIHILAAFLTLITMPASAGLVFRYTRAITGDPLRKSAGGTIWLSDGKYRHVLDPDPSNPRAWDIAIYNGTETLLLNVGNQTWYREKRPELPREAKFRGTPKVTYQVEGQEPIDGRQTTKHVIRAEYKLIEVFQGVRATSKGSVGVLVWVTEDPVSIPIKHFVTTELPAIDHEIHRTLDTITGMPLLLQVVANRAYDGGGVPNTKMTTTTFTDIKAADVPRSQFDIPKDYRQQEPIISAPGLTRTTSPYSPMIFTITRLSRRPSNSP